MRQKYSGRDSLRRETSSRGLDVFILQCPVVAMLRGQVRVLGVPRSRMHLQWAVGVLSQPRDRSGQGSSVG